MKMNVYLIVLAVIAVIIVAAALSSFVFNKKLSSPNVSISNLTNYGPAPNIQGIAAWINSQPLNLTQLRGKVVIVDFWTYSCINCIRSIPHLNAWYNAYGNNGLVIIGVSTPEFQFEHNYSNVYAAVQKFGIKYPVALDNNYSTWDAYGNEYWPADYIIDKNGDVRYVVFGEGDYNQTEEVIRSLLENAGYTIQPNLTDVPLGINFSGIGTPEIYLGYAKAREAIGNSQGFVPNETVDYSNPNVTENNTVYFSGEWYNAPDSMIAVNNSKLFLIYKADKVNIVASGNQSRITVTLDGKNLNQSELGSDASLTGGMATATVNSSRLYNIVATQSYDWHTLEINASPGFRIYTFTFG
ncbi:MAG TPA: redoxin domain-containing protein [Candidatus Saccharimonadales bacterium]|nr:redoxin domain-containing protein [Candidatus Saccharimonadales bacterium]